MDLFHCAFLSFSFISFYYPYWVGNREIIENDIRYVYQKDYDKSSKKIIYSKYEYENQNNIIEKIIIDAETGKEIK